MVENIYTQNRSMCLGLPNWLLESANIVLMIPQSPAELSLGLGTREARGQTNPAALQLLSDPAASGSGPLQPQRPVWWTERAGGAGVRPPAPTQKKGA